MGESFQRGLASARQAISDAGDIRDTRLEGEAVQKVGKGLEGVSPSNFGEKLNALYISAMQNKDFRSMKAIKQVLPVMNFLNKKQSEGQRAEDIVTEEIDLSNLKSFLANRKTEGNWLQQWRAGVEDLPQEEIDKELRQGVKAFLTSGIIKSNDPDSLVLAEQLVFEKVKSNFDIMDAEDRVDRLVKFPGLVVKQDRQLVRKFKKVVSPADEFSSFKDQISKASPEQLDLIIKNPKATTREKNAARMEKRKR